MADVIISIRPEWCQKIADGEKTIEVRKTRPKMKPTFKCYIYCTKPKSEIVGEFVCNDIDKYLQIRSDQRYKRYVRVAEDNIAHEIPYDKIGMQLYDFCTYGGGEPLYGWHISKLKIYDKGKDLRELTTDKRPPQSWYYRKEGLQWLTKR